MKITNKAKRYIKGVGIRKVSLAPDSVFRLKGKRDARRTPTVPNSNIAKLVHCTDSLVNKEILLAEEILYPVREEAATLISSISVSQKALEELPVELSDTSAVSVRSNKQLNSTRSSHRSLIRSSSNSLAAINEFIISITTALEQRIEKTRKVCLRKVSSYETGLRSGGMSDYKYEVTFNDASLEKYIAKHAKLDGKIKSLVEESEEEK